MFSSIDKFRISQRCNKKRREYKLDYRKNIFYTNEMYLKFKRFIVF